MMEQEQCLPSHDIWCGLGEHRNNLQDRIRHAQVGLKCVVSPAPRWWSSGDRDLVVNGLSRCY